MKRTDSGLISALIVIMFLLSSCSLNRFSIKKNYQPRVKVEAVNPNPVVETSYIENVIISSPPTLVDTKIEAKKESKVLLNSHPKETIMEKMVKVFFPKKREIFEPVLHPQKNKLKIGEKPTLDDGQVVGLILGILSLVSAIAAGLMIIGMAQGNILVYFAVGMILAVVAIILGAIGKKLPLKGLSIAGFVIGIVVVVALLAMLVVFTILGIL